MRKMKKLAALCLAMLMAFSIMAVTAAAYDAAGHVHDETCAEATVQPRKAMVRCPRCGDNAATWDSTRVNPDHSLYTVRHYECDGCGYWEKIL